MRQTFDGAAFGRMICSAAASIELKKQKINELNVFPVPDGDTGTNMSMTLGAAATELRRKPDVTLTKAADVAASALLRGARGNSGVILSLLFRGFSKALKGMEQADGRDFAAALTAGVEAAYKAVMKPAEGTILTVSRLTADAARDLAAEDRSIESVLAAAIPVAKAALDNTVNQNPVLKKAGVVDAGGMGFVVILEGMLSSLQGNDIVADESAAVNEQADFAEFDSEDITFAFDTVFIVRKSAPDVSLEPLRLYLDSIGDSLVIGEDDEAFKVHVHTNIPGDALSEAQKYGTLELAKIENMRMQHDDLAAGRKARSTDDLEAIEQELESAPAPQPPQPEKRYGVVAVCAGEGLASVFTDLGADRIIEGGQTMNPSTEDILSAVEQTPAEIVFVLPNNKNIILAAQAAAELAEKDVIVIESKTVPQGITALLNFDAEQSRRNMRLGYFDAQRVLYGLYGSTYYIDRTMSEDAARQQLLEYLGTDDGSLRTFHEKTLPQIAKALKCDGDYYDLLIAVLEHDAKELGIASERIMTDIELLQAILSQPKPPEAILPAQGSDTPAETEPEAADATQAAAPKAAEEVAAKAAELSQDIEKHINRLLGKMRPRRARPGTMENAEPEASADEAEK